MPTGKAANIKRNISYITAGQDYIMIIFACLKRYFTSGIPCSNNKYIPFLQLLRSPIIK